MADTINIITIVRNDEAGIERTIQSVLAQKDDSVRYIVVDGASTDGTLEKIRYYKDRIDIIVSEPDHGIYDAMNKGISLVASGYIGLVNSGDELFPGALQHLRGVLSAARGVVCGALVVFDGETFSHVSLHTFDRLPNGMTEHPSSFISKSVYDQVGLYDTQYRIAADYDMFCRLRNEGVEPVYLPHPLVKFQTGGLSMTSPLTEGEVKKIKTQYFGTNFGKWYLLMQVVKSAIKDCIRLLRSV